MTGTVLEPNRRSALASSMKAHERIAAYTLPMELDRRILDLAERKELLTTAERDEYLAWVEFTQQRSLEKWQAIAAINRLADEFPEMRSTS